MRDLNLNNPIYALYETYSLLLSQKKREIFEMAYFEDMSMSEIAELCGCTRQSISNMLSRTCRELNEYENSLGINKIQQENEEKMKKISEIADKLTEPDCDLAAAALKLKLLANPTDE